MKNEIARTVVEAEDHDENNGHVLLGQGSTIFSEADGLWYGTFVF